MAIVPHLRLSPPATKRRNSCATRMRPDAPLLHHDVQRSERPRQKISKRFPLYVVLPLIISPREEFCCLLLRHGRSDKSATVQLSGLAARIADERRKLWVTTHLADPLQYAMWL